MDKVKWMALGGIAFAALSRIALRHWGNNPDVVDLLEAGRDGLILIGFTFPISLIASKKVMEETPKVPMLLPLLFVGALLSAGCGTAGGKAWTACQLGQLSANGQKAFALAHDLADNPSSTVATLTEAALAFAPGQFDCAVKALLAWLTDLKEPGVAEGAPVARAMLGAWSESTHDHARRVAAEYLKGKTVSCAPVKVALLEPCTDACRPVVIDWGQMPELRR